MGGVALFAAILSACEPSESEDLDTAIQPLSIQFAKELPTLDKATTKSPNVASSNGAYNANPVLFQSDVVVGFEKGVGVARYAWSHDNGSNFTMASTSGLELTGDVPSDDEEFFNSYEGSPVPVSFHQAQGPSMPKSRHFVMVTMAGTDSHGLSLNNGTRSTDIFGLASIDGGETFKAPVRLNSKVGGPTDPTYSHGAITFVTAVPEYDDGFATGAVLVFWRQEK